MHFGFRVLRLSSTEFWAMTPREIFAAMALPDQGGSWEFQRSDFNALVARFPDMKRDQHD